MQSKELEELKKRLPAERTATTELLNKEVERLLELYTDDVERTNSRYNYKLACIAKDREDFIEALSREASYLVRFSWLSKECRRYLKCLEVKGLVELSDAMSVAKDILSCVGVSELKEANNGFTVLNNHLADYFGESIRPTVTAKQRCIAKLALHSPSFVLENPSRLLNNLMVAGEFETYEELLEAMR